MIFLYIFLFIISCFLLVVSGAWIVRALTKIARFLGWKEFVVAFILMAFATSIPELFVGIISALNKIPELAFGAIVGSNIIKLTLAVGLPVLILGGLNLERVTVRRNSIFVAVVALLPLLMILDGDLSRIDGAVLLLVFIFYMTWLFDRTEMFTKIYNGEESIKNPGVVKNFLKYLGVFTGSVILLLLSAEGVIWSVKFLAQSIGIPVGVIAIFLVGAGTALPEIYFSIRAAKSGRESMILGNLMGGVVITATLVLGIVALIYPIKIIDFSPYSIARVFLLVSVLFFLLVARTHEKISRKEGIILVGIYLLFILTELLS